MSKIANPRDILIKPVVSEKSYRLEDEGKYTFIVAPGANKTQIMQAVEAVFRVKVTGVNTVNRPGKRRRTRYGWGKRPEHGASRPTLVIGDHIPQSFPRGSSRLATNQAELEPTSLGEQQYHAKRAHRRLLPDRRRPRGRGGRHRGRQIGRAHV